MQVCALTLAKSPTARMVFVVCAASSRVGDSISAWTLQPCERSVREAACMLVPERCPAFTGGAASCLSDLRKLPCYSNQEV